MPTRNTQFKFWSLLALIVLVVLPACSVFSPMKEAETTEQKAFALYGTYVIFLERAATLAESPTLDSSTKSQIIASAEASSAVSKEMFAALSEYENAKELLAQGRDSEERVVIASQNLNSWIEKATPVITSLINLVQGAM